MPYLGEPNRQISAMMWIKSKSTLSRQIGPIPIMGFNVRFEYQTLAVRDMLEKELTTQSGMI